MSDRRSRENAVRKRARERAAELAAEYREAGWDALALQPANVVPIPVGPDTGEQRAADADVGLSFLLPAAEFDLLDELITGDVETEVHRGGRGDHAGIVVVLRDAQQGGALVVPLSFHHPTSAAMAREARERGRLELLVRPPESDRRVAVSLDPAAVLGPDDERA